MQLSSALTETATIRKLALVLQMDMSTVDVLITKLYKDTGLAAYSVLQEWLKGQENRKVAYINMCKALEGVDNNNLIEKLN